MWAALASLLEDILVAPFDAQAAMAYGRIRAAYKDRNRDALDKLIASHALALGVTLVTKQDFVDWSQKGILYTLPNRGCSSMVERHRTVEIAIFCK